MKIELICMIFDVKINKLMFHRSLKTERWPFLDYETGLIGF